MKIEAGKYYRARDGRKVGPMREDGAEDWIDWVHYVVEFEGREEGWSKHGEFYKHEKSDLDLIAEWTDEPDTPTPWKDMTDAEKGALLLAAHRGQSVEYWNANVWAPFSTNAPLWHNGIAYRVKPSPVVETVTMYGYMGRGYFHETAGTEDTHRITFETVDGVPDCSTVKMEPIE